MLKIKDEIIIAIGSFIISAITFSLICLFAYLIGFILRNS